jgi:hypothetical protein
MKGTQQRVVFLLAGIGFGALLFGGIELYKRHVAKQQAAAFVNAPAYGPFERALHEHALPPPQ